MDKSWLFNTDFAGLLDSICIMIFELDVCRGFWFLWRNSVSTTQLKSFFILK